MVCFLGLAPRDALYVPLASCLMACTATVSFSPATTPEPAIERRASGATIITYTAVRGSSRQFADYSRIKANILKSP
ncbi:MAG: hypothetical protein VB934_15635 [Polyangiaceae bacterium]